MRNEPSSIGLRRGIVQLSVPERELFVRGPEHHRTHHLNLVPFEGAFWRDHLLFRDRLHDEPEVRVAYGALKRQLAAAHPDDRGAYTAGKARFVTYIINGGRISPEQLERALHEDVSL